MEDRETFETITPVKKHVVILRSWITGRESQKIDGAMFKGVGTTGDGKKLAPKLSASMLADQENASIEAIVVSVDGKNNDLVNTVLNMRKPDYDHVLQQLDKVVNGDIPEKKENSSETSTTKSSTEDKVESATDDSK